MEFDKERSDAERERSECNPSKSEQFHFLQKAKNNRAKRKSNDGKIYFPKSLLAFCRNCERYLFKTKLASPMGFEPMLPG